MKKRILSWVLAAVMLLPAVAAGASLGDVTEETPYADEIEMLAGIGVVSGDDNNEFDPEGEISRADFAVMIANIMGYHMTGTGEAVFEDVPQDHYAAGAIAALSGSGILSGVGGGLFAPDEAVTYPQAAKVLVSITGYQQPAEAMGGYPTGYLMQAASIGVGGNYGQDQPLTRAQTAHLIYQALRADLRQQTVFDTVNPQYEVKRGETLLTNVMQIFTLKNVKVNATYKTTSKLNERQVQIGGEIYETGETNAAAFMGQTVTIYFKIDETAAEERVLLHISGMPQSTVVTISADDLIPSSGNVIKYSDGGRTQTVTIGKDADIMVNGRAALYDPGLFDIKNGSIRLSSSNGSTSYDLVEIESYENILVGGIDVENKVIYDRYDRSLAVRIPDDKSAICEVLLPGDETVYSFEDISDGQLISVFSSQDGQYVKIIFGGDPITAQVNEITEDEIKLGETTYKKAPSLERMPQIELGETYTFFLDIDGRVAARSSDTVGRSYGFLIEAGASTGMETEMQIKLLTADGEFLVLKLANSMKLNGTSVKPGTGEGRAALIAALREDPNTPKPEDRKYTPNGIISQLVTYQINAAGAVSELNTTETAPNPYAFSLDFKKSNQQFKSGIKTFRMKFMASSNTKIFTVSPTGSVEEEDFDSINVSKLQNDHTYPVAAYDVDDGGAAGAIVIWENAGGDTSNDSAFGVVDKVVAAISQDGSSTKKLYAIANGKYVEYPAKELDTLMVSSGGSTREVKRGDGIVFETNKKGEISKIKLEFDVTRPYEAQQQGGIFAYLWSVYGTVYSKEGNNYIMTPGVAEQTDQSLFENRDAWISFTSAGNIYVYDVEKDEVNRATSSEIYTYMMSGEHASRIYIRFRYETAKDILIYKD